MYFYVIASELYFIVSNMILMISSAVTCKVISKVQISYWTWYITTGNKSVLLMPKEGSKVQKW